MPRVAVIDYGVGNLLSVRRGFEHCGAHVEVTGDHASILAAEFVVLPGVGAFGNAMAELGRLGLDHVVREVAARGIPLFGICLGMQLLMDESEEFGLTRGLGIIAGRVVPVPGLTRDGRTRKIPHIGWNGLVPAGPAGGWSHSPLAGVTPGESAYFVHSFMAEPADPADRIADCLYGDVPIAAAVGHGCVFGCQFHPEKSGDVGLRILRRFLSKTGPS
jgi:glutamine amidotransferase